MTILGILIILILVFFDLILNKNLFSPVVMFSVLFVMIVALAELRLYGIFEFSEKSVFLILTGVICFDLGNIIVVEFLKKYKNNTNVSKERIDFFDLNINWRVLKVLTAIVTLGNGTLFYYASRFLMQGGSYLRLRNALLGYNNELPLVENPFFRFLVSYISGPALYTLIPLAMIFIVRKEHLFFSIVVFANLIFNMISSGGRITIIYTVIQFLAVLSYSKIKISFRVKRGVFLFIGVAIIAVVGLSLTRSSNSFFKSVYTYFSCPVVLLSTWMDNADKMGLSSKGLSFIYPFTYIANMVTNALGLSIDFLNSVVEWQKFPQEIWVPVFPQQSMNAFCTLFYFFYQDLREFGVAFFSFIFGIISGFVYFKAYIVKNIKYFVVFLLGVKAIIGSFMIWQVGSTSFFLSLFLLLCCFKKNVRKSKLINEINELEYLN